MYRELINGKRPDFEKALEHFRTELATVRTGRANPALVENLKVESYGSFVPLNTIGSITVSDPRSLAIQPWDKTLLPAMEKAILGANIGLQPVNDGNFIRLNIPPMTEERRGELQKFTRQLAEAARVRIRGIREDLWREITKLHRDKKLTDDAKYEAQEELKKIIDEYNEKITDLTTKKETELAII
ncbi:MAG: ribosome recycling factor [Candidatus Doudnabacteria bacterium]|nr:ribosome recycling factor [Candidatus Doudnabacteria bacterium]